MTDLTDLIDRLDGINREGGLDQRKHEIIAEAVEALRRLRKRLETLTKCGTWEPRSFPDMAQSVASLAREALGYEHPTLDPAGSTSEA